VNPLLFRPSEFIDAALAATSRGMVITDATRPDHPISYANAAFLSLCGYPEPEILGRNCRFLQGPDTDPRVRAEIHDAVAAGVGIHREILNYRKDGTSFWNDLTIDPIRDPAGKLTGFVSSQFEVTEAHEKHEALEDAASRLENIANHVPGYIYRRVMRSDGQIEIVYCSPSLSRMLGISQANVLRRFYDHVHPADRDALLEATRRSAANLTAFREEFRLVSASGVTHWMRSDAPPRLMSGEVVWDGLALEFSSEKRWESEISNLALRDPMTALLTRDAWRKTLAKRLESPATIDGRFGLVYLDIAGFHDLNDQHGYQTGDAVLRELGKRLSQLAVSVAGVAARLGGDEFAILCPDIVGEDELRSFGRACGETIAQPMRVNDVELTVEGRVGIYFAVDTELRPAATKDVDEVMSKAELALRWAKQTGGRDPVAYSEAEDDRFRNQAILARSLENAIAQNELELHYQPLVDLPSGRIVSAEALVRWRHPTLGMQRPDLFIPLAEASGLIVPLGHWVFRHAVAQRRLWQEQALSPPPIAINVSGIQLLDPEFVDFVRKAIAQEGADAKDFELELTEGELIQASPQIMASLHALRDMGFTITIDDFGSGHATFRYLRDFPTDKVKIDQVFVRKLVVGSNDALIIRAVIALARSMGIAFVAEGIETEMQRDFLQREGCLIGQGYLFSMPLVAEDFAWMLSHHVQLPLRTSTHADIHPSPGSELSMDKQK